MSPDRTTPTIPPRRRLVLGALVASLGIASGAVAGVALADRSRDRTLPRHVTIETQSLDDYDGPAEASACPLAWSERTATAPESCAS